MKNRLFLMGLVLAASQLAVAADTGPDPDAMFKQAQTLLGNKQYQEAAKLLESVTERAPERAPAWLALGRAREALGQVDPAGKAFARAADNAATQAPAVRAAFLLYAGNGRRDEAFTWYQRARHTPLIDLSGLASSPKVGKLADDPRFGDLFPARIKFEPPFVENVRIIQEWRGGNAGDEFGWEARGVGDLDGDGATDVVISAPAHPPQGDGAGHVYVFSGKSGKLLWKHSGSGFELLGNSVESAGDINRDGVPDVIAGAPGKQAAYVYSGKDGALLLTLSGEKGDEGFGTHSAGIGDFNGDNVPDLIVAAPSSQKPGAGSPDYRGRAYVFSGKTGKTLLRLEGKAGGDQFGSAVSGRDGRFFVVGSAGAGKHHAGRVYVYDKLSAVPAFTIDADATGGGLGYMFVSVMGDANHDGVPDIYASDWLNKARGGMTGRIYVYSGKSGKELLMLTGTTTGEGFGIGPAHTGDVDGDGHDDLVVGSWQYGKAAWSGGRVGVYSGSDGHLLQSFTGKVPGETLGFDAVGVGDVDGDGNTDFLVTSAWSLVNGVRSGRAYILAGNGGKAAKKTEHSM